MRHEHEYPVLKAVRIHENLWNQSSCWNVPKPGYSNKSNPDRRLHMSHKTSFTTRLGAHSSWVNGRPSGHEGGCPYRAEARPGSPSQPLQNVTIQRQEDEA